MADTIKMMIILLSISILLYMAQVSVGGTLFREDIITQWIDKDSNSGDFTGSLSEGVYNASDKFANPSSVSSNNASSLLSFWDITQIVWGFIKLIFNIFFAIPMTLLIMNFPKAIKIGLVIPLVIVAFGVITFGILGRR